MENLPTADVDTQTFGQCLALTIASTSCLLVSTLLLTRVVLKASFHLHKVQYLLYTNAYHTKERIVLQVIFMPLGLDDVLLYRSNKSLMDVSQS